MWPRYRGNFIRKPPPTNPNYKAVSEREALVGRWELVPWRRQPTTEKIKVALARSTFNARIEGIEKKLHLRSRLDERAKVHRASKGFL
jgi:hypothetical protein